jgi:hypothetical protein
VRETDRQTDRQTDRHTDTQTHTHTHTHTHRQRERETLNPPPTHTHHLPNMPGISFTKPTLFISEVVMVYLAPEAGKKINNKNKSTE